MRNRIKMALVTLSGALFLASFQLKLEAQSAPMPTASLVGTWTLAAADNLRPDGSRVQAYGPEPHGILILTADGHYTVEIFRADRMKFASGATRRTARSTNTGTYHWA